MAEEKSENSGVGETKTLSRRERRKLMREEKRQTAQSAGNTLNFKKWIPAMLVVAVIAAGIYYMLRDVSKPLPGDEMEDMGAEHVTDIAGISYNSNPPTSGPHFAVWAKPGVYDRLISDGHLIHSMEHGYIVISYDCTKPLLNAKWPMLNKEVSAHDEPAAESTDSGELLKHLDFQPQSGTSWFTPENPPEVELPLPDDFNSDSCKNLVTQLSEYTKSAERVLLVPRIEMDTPIALTAWRRILKLESLDDESIKYFIKSFHNRGPEKTLE